MKLHLKMSFLLVLFFVSPANAVTSEDIEKAYKCGASEQCAPIPEISRSCWHYCEGSECKEADRVCASINSEQSKDVTALDCYKSNPCIKPRRSYCENGRCVSE
jgi:hypothetical protein